MAYTSSLLNCRTGNGTGGSNPPLSALAFHRLLDKLRKAKDWKLASVSCDGEILRVKRVAEKLLRVTPKGITVVIPRKVKSLINDKCNCFYIELIHLGV